MLTSEFNPELEAQLTAEVGMLAASFPHVAITGETIKVYVRMLADIPPDIRAAALSQALAECEFFPTIARLRDMALALTQTGPHVSGFEAWERVVKAIRSVGSYAPRPGFDDPLIARAVDCLGWPELCQSENQVADRAHFVKVYEQLVERERQDARLLPEAREVRERYLPDARRARPILEGGDQWQPLDYS